MTATMQPACYVFGIVPADAPLPANDGAGLAAGLRLVAAGDLAALVGSVPIDRPLGRAADLRSHDRVLSAVVAAGTPVLPMRFGAVVSGDHAVVDELLAPHRVEFGEALDTLRGRVQYTVKVRYDQDEVLRGLLATDPEIRRLRGRPDDRAAQLRLGERVVRALERMRPDDASEVLTALIGTVDVRVREVSGPDEVVNAAFLVDRDRAAAFERRAEELAAEHAGRLRIALVGPSAAYDFVGGD